MVIFKIWDLPEHLLNIHLILAVVDDLTDEDMFKILPENAYSIKIGFTPSKARFYLKSPKEVRALLREIVEQ